MGGRKHRVLRGLVTGAMALTISTSMASVALADVGAPPVQHQGFAPDHAWFSGGNQVHQFAPARAWFSGGVVPKGSGNSQAASTTARATGSSDGPMIALILGIGLAGLAGAGLVLGMRRQRLRSAHAV